MDLLLNKIRTQDLECGTRDLVCGDHIYTWRNYHSYSHHGIYVGDGKVIHLTRGQRRNGFSSATSHPSEGPVESCTLEEFLSGGDLYRYDYDVNGLLFLIKRPGTCTRASSDPPEHVLYRASFLLNNDFGDYDLSNNNCEDFALYCKTELLDVKGSRKTGTSGQIASPVAVITTIFAIIFMPYGFLPTSFSGLAFMFCFFYCNSRLHFDAGSRITYVLKKVPVEEFKELSYPDTTEWMEHGTKWIPMVAILAVIVWFWSPKSIILICVRSFFLYVFLSLLVFDYLRNHRFKLYVYILNNLLALIVWHWTPESNGFQGIRTLLLHAIITVLVINPLINSRLKLWQYIDNTIWLFQDWYWTPESRILQLIRLFLLSLHLFQLVAILRDDRLMPSVYMLNSISAFILWYWTPEDTILQWIKLFLLNVCFVRLVADLRNHSLMPTVYVLNFIWALILWYWTPESTILVWLRSLLLFGFLALFVINPNFRLELGYHIDDTIWLFGLWCWTPETTILLWLRLFLIIALSLVLAARLIIAC